MIAELMVGTAGAVVGGWTWARSRRLTLYRELGGRIERITAETVYEFTPQVRHAAPRFDERLAVVENFLPGPSFAALREAILRLIGPERSFVPLHKKGGTIAYETLIAAAPAAVALYHSAAVSEFVSRVVGARVRPTPISDQSSLSVLCYDRPGDHIGWHFDHNFYCGRHFTVLLAILNEGRSEGGLSHAALIGHAAGRDVEIRTPANTFVLFEGAKLRHRVTPLLHGEKRIMLSMTYCTVPRARLWQEVSRRIKDTAFFGIRALWT